MKRLFLVPLFLFTVQFATAQNDDCKVLLDSIKGTLPAIAAMVKRERFRKSVGVHTYEGDFKAGWPEGKGKYPGPMATTITAAGKKD